MRRFEHAFYAQGMQDRPVWISLPKLFRPGSGSPPRQQSGTLVDLSVDAPGVLVGWQRGVAGQWLAVCNFEVPHIGGRSQTFFKQLIPAEAVRPRTVSAQPGEGPWT